MFQVNTSNVARGDESAFPANVDPLLLAHWQKAWRALAEFVLPVCMYVCMYVCIDSETYRARTRTVITTVLLSKHVQSCGWRVECTRVHLAQGSFGHLYKSCMVAERRYGLRVTLQFLHLCLPNSIIAPWRLICFAAQRQHSTALL